MKQYAITINVVFDSIEELEAALINVLEQSKPRGLDNYPNCLSSDYDFDLLKLNNKNVIEYLNKRRLSLLLSKTNAFIDYAEDYKLILQHIDNYVDDNDINKTTIVSLLNDLI